MKTQFLKELLDLVNTYEQQVSEEEQNVTHFLSWAKVDEEPSASKHITTTTKQYVFGSDHMNTFIVEYITRAYRYLWFYSKKAFENTSVLSFHDFLSLVTLAQEGSLTKSQLIDATLNEKTSGTLVIKRLIEKGLVNQESSEHDKRSQNVMLTQMGWAALRMVIPSMNHASTIFNKAITESERKELYKILLKIDIFHNPLYMHFKDMPLEEILDSTP
jgi:DNA-binding MarR family transcriptional regulator